MTEPTDTTQPPNADKIIDYAGKELTKPAPHLIIPATLVAVLACGLFLFINGCDGDAAAPANDDADVSVEVGDDDGGLDIDVDSDRVDVNVGDGAVEVDVAE